MDNNKKNANKKRIGAITFHSSYNHGSALQAYALQEYIKKEYGDLFEYNILNLRTKRQKDYYNKPFGYYDYKSIIKSILFRKFKKQIQESNEKYESFIKRYLNVTKEYSSESELRDAKLKYDYYISGSDQIWNFPIIDFDWSFYLEFCNSGKKISYAASLGPNKIDGDDAIKQRIKKDLSEYSNISVREAGSRETIERLTGRKDIDINIDPTLLLDEDDWGHIIGKKIIEGDYIFVYDLKASKKAFDVAEYISEQYGMPIVVVKNEYLLDRKYNNIVRKYNAGPLEFLNYVKYAKIVVTSSFHGNAFSIIFKKPFISINGKNDLRISDLLKKTGLDKRSVSELDEVKKMKDIFSIDFSKSIDGIKKEQEKSKKYLSEALDVGK